MNLREVIVLIVVVFCVSLTTIAYSDTDSGGNLSPQILVDTTKEPVADGPFKPTWESLKQYECPEWFRDIKFGIWAHWGPQCQPEANDWYARHMYKQGHWQYDFHLKKYGHPSVFGFKDVINEWQADKWDPQRLVKLYKRVGAQYFFAMANHHDNLDMWDSKYQPWNSVAVGPKKNIIKGWAEAARENDLYFGISVHAAHAWSWYEMSQGADQSGDKAGVPYDGKLTRADGKGKWWEGLDPQDLYEQNHKPSPDFINTHSIHSRWNWDNGVTLPDQAYCDKFYNRTMDLINKYQPDLLYFDDTALPLWPVSDAGLKIAAHYYNTSLRDSGGRHNGVLFGKILSDEQKKALCWDVERGVPPGIVYPAWQTDTCIGGWHYDRGVYDRGHYKSAKTVVHMLIDIVSKNGNLLLDIPVRGDGSIDEKEERILEGIAAWMDVNKEGIYSTRPWEFFGEGPAVKNQAAISAQGFNEGKGKPLTARDIRYTVSKDGQTLYVFAMGQPTNELTLTAPIFKAGNHAEVRLFGYLSPIEYRLDEQGQLTLIWPDSAESRDIYEIACVFKISGFDFDVNPAYAPNAIILKAEDAILDGANIRCEEKNERMNVGFWNDANEGVHWLLKVPEPGRYRFAGEFAALESSHLQMQINGKQVDFEVPPSGDWSRSLFTEIGTVSFDKAGIYHLKVYPSQEHNYRPVNLWKIQCWL